jgi:Ca2+-binding RTX toxin-like protein
VKRLLTWLVPALGVLLVAPAAASATITTTAAPAAPIVVGATLTDAATVTLANVPLTPGTVTFELFGPDNATCQAPAVFTSDPIALTLDGLTGTAATTGFAPAQPGVYRWIATYSGDDAVPPNPAESTACGDALETQVVQAQPAISTLATNATLGAGTISDTATLTGLHNPTANGSVTFNVFAPGDTACQNPLTAPDAVALDPITATATSTGFTPTAAGDHRWTASYSGDANNAPVSGACNDAGETSTVAKAQPAITTLASPNITVGAGSLSDQATVTGIVSPVGPQTVTFALYGPNDATCAGTAVFVNSAPLNGDASQSAPFTPATAGTYRWRATYDGDDNNNPATSACNELTETRTVARNTPAIATVASPDITLGAALSDQATVSGLVNGSAGANITFELFGPNDATCAGAPVASLIQSGLLNATGTTLVVASGGATPAAAGVYRWRATFNGDVNNTPVAGVFNAEIETRTVANATPPICSRASARMALGAGTLTDAATLTGVAGVAPTGAVTFQLFGPDDAACGGGAIFTNSGALTTGGGAAATASSAPFTPAVAGVYRWRAVFAGDANFLGVSTPCNDTGESVAVGPRAPTPVPVAAPPPPPPPPPPPSRPPAAAARATCNARVATIVGTGQARLTGTPGDDVIVGTAAAERIDGGGGNDTICAGAGADTVNAGADQDVVFGGEGDDRLRGGSGNDRVFGDDGDDLVLGNAGEDELHGGRGADRMAGGDGFDTVDGEAGNDVLDDQKLGGAGRDRLLGGSGADQIRTRGGGADVVDCGAGRDTLTRDRTDRQKRCETLRR